MGNIEVGKKKRWPLWTTIVVILLWLVGLTFWVQYERTQFEEKQKEQIVAGKPILHISKQGKADDLCECPKPKKRAFHKKAKPKQKTEQKKEAKSEPITNMPAPVLTANSKFDVATESQKEDFYDKAVMPKTWVTEPEEDVAQVEPPRVGRKIIVVRQRPMMKYYGGYRSDYYQPYTYAPQVTYGQPYIPPPRTVFVPAPTVFVPAPSVVTPAPSVVTPNGGHRPQGSTGGHSPSGTTGTAL